MQSLVTGKITKPRYSVETKPVLESRANGLLLPDKLSFEEWMALKREVVDRTTGAAWALGDWMAFGDRYSGDESKKRVPDGFYAQIAEETGYSEQTLRNMKCVCSRLPLPRRKRGLTISHATEIVGRVEESDFDHWIEKVVREKLSVKSLRTALRAAGATVKPEPNDYGTRSILEVTQQYIRDLNHESPKLKPRMRQELLRMLEPSLAALRQTPDPTGHR